MAHLRRLNQHGITAMQEFLCEVAVEGNTPVPMSILSGLSTSEELQVKVEVKLQRFGSRMAAADYMFRLFSEAGVSGLDREQGIWAWLSLFYFQELCPKQKDGGRRPGKLDRWIPSGHAWRYYRHLLAGPYLIYKSFRGAPEDAEIVLCGPLDRPGDFVEQLASRQDFVQNKGVIKAATLLYLDKLSRKPKRGASPTEHKLGTLRRFVDIINQLEPTWDLQMLTAEQLLQKLPSEFTPYIQEATAT